MEHEDITTKLQEEQTIIQQNLQRAIQIKEETWRLKSRSLWLKVGDINTTHSHMQAKS
jgi:hypothetical protein